MQKYSLRALTGARGATRYESILLCLGLTTMETRVHQLKLMYYNKLKTFDEDLYVHKIFKHKMTTESRMKTELLSIFNIYKNHPDYEERLLPCEDFDCKIKKSVYEKSYRQNSRTNRLSILL